MSTPVVQPASLAISRSEAPDSPTRPITAQVASATSSRLAKCRSDASTPVLPSGADYTAGCAQGALQTLYRSHITTVMQSSLELGVSSEFDPIESVAMCLAQPMVLSMSYVKAIDVVSLHQLA